MDSLSLPNCKDGEKLFFTKMDDNFILQFKRMTRHPNDCVINAMEVMGLMSSDSAAFLRFMKRTNKSSINRMKPPQGKPMSQEEIMGLLTICYPEKSFRFGVFKSNQYKELFVDTIKTMPNGFATIAYQIFKSGLGHAFVIGKSIQGLFYLIDAQRFTKPPFMCELSQDECYDYLTEKQNSVTLIVTIERKATNKELDSRLYNGLFTQDLVIKYYGKNQKTKRKNNPSLLCRRKIDKNKTKMKRKAKLMNSKLQNKAILTSK